MKGYNIFDEMKKDWTLRMKIRDKIFCIQSKIYYKKLWIKLQLLECQIELTRMAEFYCWELYNLFFKLRYKIWLIADFFTKDMYYEKVHLAKLEKQYKKLSRKK